MDGIDAKILNYLQEGLPFCTSPFQELADLVGISEAECLERISRLKEIGIIRRLGGVFNSPQMGIRSTLCAMRVPEAQIDMVAGIVNSYQEVTHNYLRNSSYNMWFTVSADSIDTLKRILAEIEEKSGIKVASMPVRRAYKIKVIFPIEEI